MPNRYTRESAIESEAVNALTWQGEVFYRRLINRVDDFGRMSADIRILRAKVFPLQLDKVTEKDVARLLTETESVGLVFTYDTSGKRFLVMNKWEQGRAKHSEYPPPPSDICERMQTYVYKGKQKFADAPDTDSDSDSNSDTEERMTIARELISHLNKQAGRHFRPEGSSLKAACARLSEVKDDASGVMAMIDRQCALWKGDPVMDEFLRPETLFRKSKFAGYYDNRNLPALRKGDKSAPASQPLLKPL